MTTSIRRKGCFQLSALALFLAFASSCAGSPATKLSDAALSGDPDAMWSEGQDLAGKGERLVKKVEQRMAKARGQIRDGEFKIRKGNEVVLTSRRDYENAVASAGDAKTPKVVKDEAKRLKAIGKRWETGRAEVREGRIMIETGGKMMRNSERSTRGDELLPIIQRSGSTSER